MSEAGWERRLENLARAQRESVGRCGAASPSLGFSPTSICALPAGHAGWHREGLTEWGLRHDVASESAQDDAGGAGMGGRDTETGADGAGAQRGAEGFVQLCPKCNGQGTVAKPPWIPGDVHTWNSGTTTPYRCNLCDGRMVIAQ